MVDITLATREKSKLRIALAGVSGGGKTLGALLLAAGLTGGDFSKVCLIDTEHRRGLLYANRSDLGIGQFYHIELKAPYSPDHYKEAVDAAVKTVGPEGVVIVDSLSHAWSNAGGVLEIKAGIAAQPGKNSYTAWDEAGRIQNDFINYLLSVNCHTICTLRVKQDYVLTENDRGKQVPVKVGLAPVQRDDVEYEFDIMFNIGRDHIAATSKDVTFLDGFNAVITPELGRQLAAWADEGKEPVRCEECGSLVAATGKMTIEQLAGYTREHYGKCLCSACAVKAERARRAAEKKEQEAAHEAQVTTVSAGKRTSSSRRATPGARCGRTTYWRAFAASPAHGRGSGLRTGLGSPMISRPPSRGAAGASSASISPKATCPFPPSVPTRWRTFPARRMQAASRWWRCAGTAPPWTAFSRGTTSATASRAASAAA